MAPKALCTALNAHAADAGWPLMVSEAVPVPHGLSARFDSIRKAYHYRMYFPAVPGVQRAGSPLLDADTAWHLPTPLDTGAMRRALQVMRGRQDCSVLRSRGCQSLSPVKDIESLEMRVTSPPPPTEAGRAGFTPPLLQLHDDVGDSSIVKDALRDHLSAAGQLTRVDITVSGPSFLYNMVRNIAGLLVWVGRGHTTPEAVAEAFAAGASRAAIPYKTAPAKGLTLLGVQYPPLPHLMAQVQQDMLSLCGCIPPIDGGSGMTGCAARHLLQRAINDADAERVSRCEIQAAVQAVRTASDAQCCRAVHLARRIREMANRGTLNDDGWHALQAKLADAPPEQATKWARRRQLADQRTDAIMRHTWEGADLFCDRPPSTTSDRS